MPAAIPTPGSQADSAQYFASSSATATACRTATTLCSDASTPQSTLRNLAGSFGLTS